MPGVREIARKLRQLNEKQERFCREYVKNNNGSEAARIAGYSEKTANYIASNLLRKVYIKDRINQLSEPIIDDFRTEVKVDRHWVINQAVRIVKSCGQLLTLRNKNGDAILGDDGQPIQQPINPKAVNQSLNLIADVLALKTETHLNVNLSAQDVLAEVERRQALTTSHVEPPVLTVEDSLYLPKSSSESDNHG